MGVITKKPDFSLVGETGSEVVLGYMILYELTISGALMNITAFLMVIQLLKTGTWEKGPGMDLFHKIKQELGDLPIIAEDLGFLTDSVKQLLKDSGYPGMKVLQFAFDSREDSDYLPHNYQPNCVVYTGTHDNDTLQGWYQAFKRRR